MKTKKRPIIGVMTGHYLSDYPQTIIRTIQDRLKDEDVELRLYSGINANLVFETTISSEGDDANVYENYDEGFGLHWISLFEYSRFNDLDLLVVCYGNILSSHPYNRDDHFLERLADVPKIILGSRMELDNIVNVTIDNYTAMKEGVTHLIECHGARRIGFIAGPQVSQSAAERMRAYRDAMAEHDLTVSEEQIVYGNYLNNVDDIVRALFEKNAHLDAVVSANDEMCNAVYRVAKERGLTVGKDIAVIGFDDAPFAASMEPPLTTVRQDYESEVDGALEIIREVLSGKKPQSRRKSAKLILRSSCGCDGKAHPVASGTDFIRYDELYRSQIQNLQAAVTLRNLLLDAVNEQTFFDTLAKEMHLAGARSSYVFLCREPLSVSRSEEFVLPEELYLYMRQEGESCEGYAKDTAKKVPRCGMDDWVMSGEKRKMAASFLLFYRNYQYGVLVVETDAAQLRNFYTLSLQIGSALRYLSLALRQQRAQRMLEEQNQILDFAAFHDGLTGLYNRAGVMQQMLGMIREDETATYVAVMGDLDHLKQINDTFGHDAGDAAIKKAAEVLREALPAGSPLGRSGGDEFTGMFRLTEKGQADRIKESIRAACEAYNEVSGAPYYVGVSVGMYPFSHDEETELSAMLKKADEALYEAKKLRRANVVRSEG